MTNRKYGCIHTPKETLDKVPFALDFTASGSAALPLLASSTDYYSRWKGQFVKLGLLGNDYYGNCVIVAIKSNLPGTQAVNSTGTLLSCTEDQALEDYSAITGFKKGDPDTDNGTDPLVALQWYQQQGAILAFGQVDVTNPAHLACAIEYFGGVALALDFPGSWQTTTNWDVTDEDPEGGHMIVLGSVNANGGYDVETWAEDPPPVITQAAVTQRAQAGWVTISTGWFETNGQTLQDFRLADLQAALRLVA